MSGKREERQSIAAETRQSKARQLKAMLGNARQLRAANAKHGSAVKGGTRQGSARKSRTNFNLRCH